MTDLAPEYACAACGRPAEELLWLPPSLPANLPARHVKTCHSCSLRITKCYWSMIRRWAKEDQLEHARRVAKQKRGIQASGLVEVGGKLVQVGFNLEAR